MAFVYRSQNRAHKASSALGPGVYYANPTWQKGNKPHSCFKSTISRFVQSKQQRHSPGPGHYEHDHKHNEKIVIKTGNEQIKIVDPPAPTACFKSTSNRFRKQRKDNSGSNVGPGTYYPDAHRAKKIFEMQIYKPSIILDIMKVNNYQSIPSIPSNIHVHGYSESENHLLELNQIKPATEETNLPKFGERTRGLSWSKQAVKNSMFDPSKTTTTTNNVGPGSYEVSRGPKSLSAYMSNAKREYQKGELTMKHLAQKISLTNQTYFKAEDNLHQESTELDSQDGQYEFIDDTTPGPGYYQLPPTTLKLTKEKKRPEFINSRFSQHSDLRNLGPGSYNLVDPNKLNNRRKRKQPPFNSHIERFQHGKIKQDSQPGPGSYDCRVEIQSQLVHKLQTGYKGKFGSIQPRFKYNYKGDEPGPGYYAPLEEQNDKESNTSSFLSKVKKNIQPQNNYPAPGTYDTSHGTIEKRMAIDQETDPDLIINRPGFGVGAERFNEGVKEEVEQEENEPIEMPKKRKQRPTMPRQIRFKQKKEGQVGPGEYESMGGWNKKSFNILFAMVD